MYTIQIGHFKGESTEYTVSDYVLITLHRLKSLYESNITIVWKVLYSTGSRISLIFSKIHLINVCYDHSHILTPASVTHLAYSKTSALCRMERGPPGFWLFGKLAV